MSLAQQQNLDRQRALLATPRRQRATVEPLDFNARTGDELRPDTLAQMIGQDRLRALLGRIVTIAKVTHRPLDHMLLVGSAGTGKTSLAQVIAHEVGADVYMLKAPVALDVFEALAERAKDGDVVVIDEIHLQVSGDRRGITQAADPETFYHVLEDRRLLTQSGVIEFPRLTFIGATTDAGLLPEPFLDRFPLKPQLDEYTTPQMAKLAERSARKLGLTITPDAALTFAEASRATPRQINTYVKNATSLATPTLDQRTNQPILLLDKALAVEIIVELNSTTLDGFTRDQQNMLKFLLRARHKNAKGDVTYKAGLGSIATAIGKSRDSKAVALYVEPYLMKRGMIAVTNGGRELTPAGVKRAEAL